MGPDRNIHLRNAAIVILLAVVVWKLPGGGTAADVVSNLLGLIFQSSRRQLTASATP